jgi:hypothetical protein
VTGRAVSAAIRRNRCGIARRRAEAEANTATREMSCERFAVAATEVGINKRTLAITIRHRTKGVVPSCRLLPLDARRFVSRDQHRIVVER